LRASVQGLQIPTKPFLRQLTALSSGHPQRNRVSLRTTSAISPAARQLLTGLVTRGLARLLKRNGAESVAEVVGADS
jgi:hypothetical protein